MSFLKTRGDSGIDSFILLLVVILFVSLAAVIVNAASNDINWIGNSVSYHASEDTVYHHNLTANITGSGANITFSVSEGGGNDVKWNGNVTAYSQISSRIYIANSTTGDFVINATKDNETGIFVLPLKVAWTNTSESPPNNNYGSTVLFSFNVTPVNDPPYFVGLQNVSFNSSQLFENIIDVKDEENDVPYALAVNFTSCAVAQWSNRGSNCTLFGGSQYSFNSTSGRLNISFTPSRNDVGSYIINFSVRDYNNYETPYNASFSTLVNFTVLNVNAFPYFRYVCDNERSAAADTPVNCWINFSDVDETNNITITSNYSWFLFNSTLNSSVIPVNLSTSFNGSAFVNFTPNSLEVGNWSVNISLLDTGSPARTSSTAIWFFINYTEHNVSLQEVANQTVYANKTVYLNATDDDLLVPDKSIKNESLTFASNTSWVVITGLATSANKTAASILINYDFANANFGQGNKTIKINVSDRAGNSAERVFIVQILSDSPPTWNQSLGSLVSVPIYENNLTYLNLSKNVTDAEGDPISFAFTNDTAFSSFNISLSGIINFTPSDADVGQHIITVNASDGKLISQKQFNFTVYNVPDSPVIQTPLQVSGANVDADSNINATENNLTTITLWIQDDDFKVPIWQKGFYNESLAVNLSIAGANTSLISFLKDNSYPTGSGINANVSKFDAVFIPIKSDVGMYNLSINVSDRSNLSSFLVFNLTINAVNNPPVMTVLLNYSSAVNRSFYLRVNVTDIEDGSSNVSGNKNFTFYYNFISGAGWLNSSSFNSSTGAINITFSSSVGGSYRINMSVNDSGGKIVSQAFWVFVYNAPVINYPSGSYIFNLSENTLYGLIFNVNHSVANNLTYEFYTNGLQRYNLSYYGNGSNLTWNFTPNFTDESHSTGNLTLVVYPSDTNLENAEALNTTFNWGLNINHTNAPVVFSGDIPDKQAVFTDSVKINLMNYFSDIDNLDPYYNQTLAFTVSSNTTPSLVSHSVSSGVLVLSAAQETSELISVSAADLDSSNATMTNASSNNFLMQFTTPSTTATPSSGGGGGGGGAIRPTLLKLIMPGPISGYSQTKIVLPINLSNEGSVDLFDIVLSASVSKNGKAMNKVNLSFDKSSFSSLETGKKAETNLTVFIDTNETGLYDITINGNVGRPKYTDWGTIYLNVEEVNESDALKSIVFTEELIAQNPQCIEIKEVADEARKLYDQGSLGPAMEKAKEAVDACEYSISQKSLARMADRFQSPFYVYLALACVASLLVGVLYYFYRRIKFRRGFGFSIR